jgi:hypothetical protein
MSNPLTSPDGAWLAGSVAAAFIGGPLTAYVAAKRGARKAESTEHAVAEHEATRAIVVDAVTAAVGAVIGPVNGRLDEMHKSLADIGQWQAEHATTHAVSELTRPALMEYRKGS